MTVSNVNFKSETTQEAHNQKIDEEAYDSDREIFV